MNISRKLISVIALSAAFTFAQDNQNTAAPAPQPAEAAAEATAAPSEAQPAEQVSQPATAQTAATAEAQPAMSAETQPAAAKPDVPTIGNAAPTPDYKKNQNKISYDEFQQQQKQDIQAQAQEDSVTCHHSISLMFGMLHDKRYGNFDKDNDIGTDAGIYYGYRHYFNNYVALEGRLGGIYRYSRFTDDDDVKHGKIASGKTYDLNIHTNLHYGNIAADLPISVKVGAHVSPTMFFFMGGTFGVTKSIYEWNTITKTLDVKNKSAKFKSDIATLSADNKNYLPAKEEYNTDHVFDYDDWETNGWINLGIDSKFVSFEFQMLMLAASTKDNHRYEYFTHDARPSWRAFLDFSIR